MKKTQPIRLRVSLTGENSPPVSVSIDGSNGYDLSVEQGKTINVEFERELVLAGNVFLPMRPILRIERGDPNAPLDVPKAT